LRPIPRPPRRRPRARALTPTTLLLSPPASRDDAAVADARRSRSRSRSPRRPAAPASNDGVGEGSEWRRRLDSLIELNYIQAGEVDSATIASLHGLDPKLAELAVARFAESNFARITNKSGFLMVRRGRGRGWRWRRWFWRRCRRENRPPPHP